jgi:hypothetical protein
MSVTISRDENFPQMYERERERERERRERERERNSYYSSINVRLT